MIKNIEREFNLMNQKTLKLKPEFIGKAIYDGFEKGPEVMDGVKGTYFRHLLFNEEHGSFHVITKATPTTIDKGQWVEVIDPVLYIDYDVNGRGMEPAKNIWADKLEVVNQ